ncbi:hypothetical protein E3N88_19328 [Mikania micrantha]|uniref:Disease resistance protein Roq1-like winged-helix domain-containing protein n=1 Tax=Mikania micrantha TaxID=192012 RepID=A0A5N6NMX3_9ASTR|nr:hypothetical protein E3N88_19328 [Mikania micrantha]
MRERNSQSGFDKSSFNFEGACFIENMRERNSQSGLKELQQQVLRDVLKDKNITVNVKWIIDVTLLSDEEAIRLFSRHAFKRNNPCQEYEKQSHEVVRYAAGLPLTIKVLGSSLYGKNKPEWIDAISRLKTIPLKETLKKLKLSYDSLEDDYKEMFLDVACLLRHWKKDDAIIILESCGFHAINGLRVLEQKSLLKVVGTFRGGEIRMHDHIVEMGENIVRWEHPDEPNKHSRLWVQEEIERVLANGMGTEATCLALKITPGIVLKSLGNMKKLRFLIMDSRNYDLSDYHVKNDEARHYFPNSLQYLYCYKYPHWCLPKTFEANNLVALEMFHSKIKQLLKRRKSFVLELMWVEVVLEQQQWGAFGAGRRLCCEPIWHCLQV